MVPKGTLYNLQFITINGGLAAAFDALDASDTLDALDALDTQDT